MPVSFRVPIVVATPPPPVDPMDLGGEDVALVDLDRIPDRRIASHGDWEVVRDVPAARQSVLREASATPGSLVRRPDWGWGGRDAVMRPASRAQRDDLEVRARRRLAANARVTRTVAVEVQTFQTINGAQGIRVTAQVEAGGRDARIVTTFGPKGE